MSDRCTVCGLPIAIGDYPCITVARPHQRGINGAIGDECDFWQENGARDPIHFRHKSDFRAWMESKGYENRVEHRTLPGTDRSPYTTDWSRGSVDLAAASAAVSADRRRTHADTPDPDVPIAWTIRELETA